MRAVALVGPQPVPWLDAIEAGDMREQVVARAARWSPTELATALVDLAGAFGLKGGAPDMVETLRLRGIARHDAERIAHLVERLTV